MSGGAKPRLVESDQLFIWGSERSCRWRGMSCFMIVVWKDAVSLLCFVFYTNSNLKELPALWTACTVCFRVKHGGQRSNDPQAHRQPYIPSFPADPCCLMCAVSILRRITLCFGLSQSHFSSILLSVLPLCSFSRGVKLIPPSTAKLLHLDCCDGMLITLYR